MNSPIESDIRWLAFRYAAGELPADEHEAFERRLAEDDAACDAVEQAVELLEAVRLAAPRPAAIPGTRRKANRSRPIVWAAAATILLALGGAMWFGLGGPDWFVTNTQPARANPVQIALHWAELHRPNSVLVDGRELSPVVESTAWEGWQAAPGSQAAVDEATLPRWLVTAVSAGADQTKELP